jgi:putative salt-induced outer membrane protein YdiY
MIQLIILLRTYFMKRCFFYGLFSLMLLGAGSHAQAGMLWLNNGDKIAGEPDELSGGTLLWVSDSAGPLKISQLNIVFIESDRDMLLQVGQGSLLEECRFEVDDGKPLDPPVPSESTVSSETSSAAGDLVATEGVKNTSNKASGKPGARQAQKSSKPEKIEEKPLEGQSGVAPESPAEGVTTPVSTPKPVPQQWVMCKEKGFILSGWNQVSRFFEFKPPVPDRMKTSGSLTVFLEDESGNTDERTIDTDINAEFRFQKSRHILAGEYNLESKSGTDTKDERKVSYQYDRFFTERWFWAGNGSWEKNKFKDLAGKWIAGGGVGYQFFETELLKVSAQGGLSYVSEDFSDDDERDFPAIRSAVNVNWLLSENGLRFVHTSLFYQGLDGTDNWVIETDTGFSMPLIGHFKASFLFEYDYDNYPSSTAEKEDRVWKVGISYEWGGATALPPQ